MKRKLRGFAGSLERADLWLLAGVAVLLLLGSVVVYGAGSFNRQAAGSPLGQHYIISKHVLMIVVGLALMVGLMHLDYRWLRRRWLNWSLLAGTLALVAITLFSDREINRWITLFGFSVQPVEAAKIAVIFFLAERLTGLTSGRSLAGRQLATALVLGPLPLIALLVLQPNFGNVMVVAGVTLVILFIAEVPGRWLAALVAVPMLGAVVAFRVVPKLATRLDAWLQGVRLGEYSYQVQQSLIGLGAGGVRGLGIGQSHNKFSFLPESHTDFAFSVLGEEWGLSGTLLVVIMLGLITWRGYGIAARAADPFGRVVAAGLTSGLAIYGVANIAMVTGIFPVVGVPLPFVSFGGTAMLAALASVGILFNIERGSRSYQVWKRRWDRSGT